MKQSKKVRDAFFDNYKAFLILCVVVGHFLDHFTEDFRIAEILRVYIYFFHIPAFSFISGYFARKNNFRSLIQKLFIPYIIFQLIYFFMYTDIGLQPRFTLLSPFFTLWYLLALFCWRLVIDRLNPIRCLIPISIACSILIGFLPAFHGVGDIYRIVSFFPFFVMGHHFQVTRFREKICNPVLSRLSAMLMIVFFIFICFNYDLFEIPVLNCQSSYEAMGVGPAGWIYRLLYILFATCLVYAIGIIMPKKNMPFTFLGKYTMRVYLCHGVVYKYLSRGTDALDIINGPGDFCLYLTAVILLAFALSQVPVEPAIDFIIALPKKMVNRLKRQYN